MDMNTAESHAWKFAASCAFDEMLRMVRRLLQEGTGNEGDPVASRLSLAQGSAISWQTAGQLENVMDSLALLLKSSQAHHLFWIRLVSAGFVLPWQVYVRRTGLPCLSCGLDAEAEDLDEPLRSAADRVLLDQLSRGLWSFLYHAARREWVGDPLWIYLKHKCDRVASVRSRLLKDSRSVTEPELSAAMGLHALLASALERKSRRTSVTRVNHDRLDQFLSDLDGLLMEAIPSATLGEALASLGAEPRDWFSPH
jgi:hypothetical protein